MAYLTEKPRSSSADCGWHLGCILCAHGTALSLRRHFCLLLVGEIIDPAYVLLTLAPLFAG
jgi:hypothetical protein